MGKGEGFMKNNETLFTDYLKSSGKSLTDVAMAMSMTSDTESKEFKAAFNTVVNCYEFMDKNPKHHEMVARAAGMPDNDVVNYVNDVRMYYALVEPEKTKDWLETCDKVNKQEEAQCKANAELRNTEHDAKWLPKIIEIKGKGTAWVAAEEAKEAAKQAEKKAKKEKKAEKKVVVAEPTTIQGPNESYGEPSADPFGDGGDIDSILGL